MASTSIPAHAATATNSVCVWECACSAPSPRLLLTLSCKQRGICPSCDAKRAAAFAAFLQDELLENVGHSMWTFTIPKMLRPYFMHHRELLADMARLAYETIQELMAEAVGDPRARPGVVSVPQTFGGAVRPHPHAHCLASRGVWNEQGQWIPVAYIDTTAAEKLFRFIGHFNPVLWPTSGNFKPSGSDPRCQGGRVAQ